MIFLEYAIDVAQACRDWYELSTWNLVHDDRQTSCANCGTPLAGVFDQQPGTWGARRQPLQITGE